MRMITSSLNNQQNRKFLKLMLKQKLLQSVATCNKRTRTEMTSMNRNCLGLFLDFWSTRLEQFTTGPIRQPGTEVGELSRLGLLKTFVQ